MKRLLLIAAMAVCLNCNSQTWSSVGLSDILYVNKDYTVCRSVVNNLALYQNADNQREIQNYILLQNCLLDLAGQGKTIYELTSAQEQIIRNIASTNTPTALKAKEIIKIIANEEFEYSIQKFSNSYKNLYFAKSNNESSPNLFELYPNPNDGRMNLYYELEENGEVIIYDNLGRKISRYILDNNNNYLIIYDNKIDNGIYTYRIFTNSKCIYFGKFVVIK